MSYIKKIIDDMSDEEKEKHIEYMEHLKESKNDELVYDVDNLSIGEIMRKYGDKLSVEDYIDIIDHKYGKK